MKFLFFLFLNAASVMAHAQNSLETVETEAHLKTAMLSFQNSFIKLEVTNPPNTELLTRISNGSFEILVRRISPLFIVNEFCSLDSIQVTGTAENPVYHCVVPKGSR